MRLVDGEIKFPCGQIEIGKREYIPELKDVYLIEGQVTFPDGTIKKGTWTYDATKNTMVFSPN